jgi:hypothetical protein
MCVFIPSLQFLEGVEFLRLEINDRGMLEDKIHLPAESQVDGRRLFWLVPMTREMTTYDLLSPFDVIKSSDLGGIPS